MKYCTGDVWVVELPWSERNGAANWLYDGSWLTFTFGSKSPMFKAGGLGGNFRRWLHDKTVHFGCYHVVCVGLLLCVCGWEVSTEDGGPVHVSFVHQGAEMPTTYVKLLEERLTSQRK